MLTIRQALFRGIRNWGGQKLAEIEVLTDDPAYPRLLVSFRKGPKGYQLVQAAAVDADWEVDWFDNDLHEACRDVTMTLLGGPSHLGVEDRKSFAERVLSQDGVRQALDTHFAADGR